MTGSQDMFHARILVLTHVTVNTGQASVSDLFSACDHIFIHVITKCCETCNVVVNVTCETPV